MRNDCIDGHNVKIISTQRIKEIATAIQDMRDAGHGCETHPMAQLHRLVIYGYLQQRPLDDMLKTALKLCYVIGAAQYPLRLETDRLDTLYYLAEGAYRVLSSHPDFNVMALLQLYYYLRTKLIGRVEKCFEEDPIVVAHEKKMLEEDKKDKFQKRPAFANFYHSHGRERGIREANLTV